MAVEKRPLGRGKGIKGSGFVAGQARLVVLPAASMAELGGFVRGAIRPRSDLLTDGFAGYAGLGDAYHHHAIVQGKGENAEHLSPIVHVLFSNLKTWLNGTYHGVGAKLLPRYVREWTYRFNRRKRFPDMIDFVLNRAMTRPTITYRELVDGMQPSGALPALTG